jgi:N-acetyl-anhydromuramoyl-L-alanine amidase
LNSIGAPRYVISPAAGLLSRARQSPSPNQDDRPPGAQPELIIVHGISLPPGEFGGSHIESLFNNCLDWDAHPYFQEIRGTRVSAHLLLRRCGEVIQFVPFGRRAWHAGTSAFRGRSQCNDFSIGIELEGTDDGPYTDEQYLHLTAIIHAIMLAYPLTSTRSVAGHCDVAPGRKTDPGPAFDWLRLYDGLEFAKSAPGKS